MANKERIEIVVNPYLMNDILIESIRVRKECQIRMEELHAELVLLYERRRELDQLSNKNSGSKVTQSLGDF